MKFIFANLALLALQAHMALALIPNLEESPQILSDTTDVCTTSGNRPTCEVELDVPASCVSGGQSDCPIVFFLHGSGGTNDWFARTSGVHTAGYIGIYPQGEGGWNTGPKNTNVCSWEDFECSEDPDEGAFIANIISKVRSEGANGNVYVIGNSNGAALAMRLASNAGTELPIKGIVTKVTQLLSSPERSGPGVLNYNQPSSTSPKVSVLNVMGTGDGLIPYSGGPSGVFSGDDAFQLMDALESMIVWAEHNGCSTEPDVTPGLSSDQGSGATFYDYKGCDGGTIVEHYAILEGGHGAGGASINGEKIDYDIAFDFINRCEEGSTPVPPSMPPAPSITAPVIAPTPAPVPNVCEDDPTWVGKFNAAHTCSHVGLDSDIRCNWENSDGVKASVGCPATCGTCSTPPTTLAPESTPSLAPVTLAPVTLAPVVAPIAAPTVFPTSWNLGDPTVDITADWASEYAQEGTETLIPREEGSIMNFQPPMTLPEDAINIKTDCPHQEQDLRDWNDPTLEWPAFSTTGTPQPDGTDVTLPANTSVIIRANMLLGTSVSPYGKISIPSGSRLIFDDTGRAGEAIKLHTMGIVVHGALEAGSPTCRVDGRIQITLHGQYGSTDSDRVLSENAKNDWAIKGIVVMSTAGARWDFHGKLYHPTWTRLAAHVPGNIQLETTAPSIRNSVLFLQDCVNWPDDAEIIITTSRIKDTRDYNFNEKATIATNGVNCVSVDGKTYGQVQLTSPLEHYHHAGAREYQCEVGLLTRNILIQGNDKSDPSDNQPLACPASRSGWSSMPCPNTFLTGFGGHTIVVGQGEGRLRGIEFWRMGMTNILGRYPVHFHHSTTGQKGEVADCSVHHSYFRAVTIHDAFALRVSRNVAYDITGHAFYLESGVEEYNRVEYNLASFVHAIDGAVLMGGTEPGSEQTEKILIPADHTASGFYVSNAHNYIIGNAASGGWAGLNFPVLPEPADKTLRYNGVVPKDRPALLITGNSVHSSSWFSSNSGSVYAGGSLFWEEDDVNSEVLKYNAGRVSSSRLTRTTKDEFGKNAWFHVDNTTAWLVGVGATGWGKRSEYQGFEVHDFQQKAIFVLFATWLDNIVINCRTSNANRVPAAGNGSNENFLNSGKMWPGFQTYDHLMQHILTNWKISNCGGVARGLDPWVEGGKEDNGNMGLFTVPLNGFAPEIQLISKGTEYDWETLGGQSFVNESIFFAGSGNDGAHSMQYMSNWEDADGSMTLRGTATVMGPARAGSWWHLDYRPGRCEVRDQWKFPQRLCDKENRSLGSMFTTVNPQNSQQRSLVPGMLNPSADIRRFRQGSMTHFGLEGDGSVTACTPPESCGETTSRSWDPDLTGPFNHSKYGGWYLAWDEGTPTHLTVQRIQLDERAVMLQAMSVPDGILPSDVHLWAESSGRIYNFTHSNNLDEVRSATVGDKYWLDTARNTLYWRVITGYVKRDLTFDWIDREAEGLQPFTRAGLTVVDITRRNQFQLHIQLNCEEDGIGAFCASKPSFQVPEMGCPVGQVMVAIDMCGAPCELDGTCSTQTPTPPSQTNNPTTTPTKSPTEEPTNVPTKVPTNAPTSVPTNVPTSAPTNVPTNVPTLSPVVTTPPTTSAPVTAPVVAPIAAPIAAPTSSCVICSDQSTPWMIENGYDCSTGSLTGKCNLKRFWWKNGYCRHSCFAKGLGYAGDNCCAYTCEDDPTWRGQFSLDHNCAFVGLDPINRCNWISAQLVSAKDACRATCDPMCSN